MFHDITPHKFDNSYLDIKPSEEDYIIFFKDNELLVKTSSSKPILPNYSDIKKHPTILQENIIYLFRIDEHNFFLLQDDCNLNSNDLSLQNFGGAAEVQPKWLAFAIYSAYHLYTWYNKSRYCGRCGSIMKNNTNERSMKCEKCGNIIYPLISPVIIVGVIMENKLLITRYSDRAYQGIALIAGFVEFGETLEQAVMREVKEEVGLKVKDIRYYGSQPWALSNSLIMGFFARLDDCNDICLDENELSEAYWLSKDELPDNLSNFSITYEMINAFKSGAVE